MRDSSFIATDCLIIVHSLKGGWTAHMTESRLESDMRDINELKDAMDSKTTSLFLLGIPTAGIYPVMWLYSKYKEFDRITGAKTLDNNYIIWIAVCLGLSMVFDITTDETTTDAIFLLLSSGFSIATGVLYVVWAFRAKKALQEYALTVHHLDFKMNPVWTFLFNIFYINYCINDLPEEKRKQDIVRGAPPSA